MTDRTSVTTRTWSCPADACITQIGTDGSDPSRVDAVHAQKIADHQALHAS